MRFFAAAGGGLIGAAMSGTILVVLLMVFTDSTSGLSNIRTGIVIGAIIGTLVGCLFPRSRKSLIGLFARVYLVDTVQTREVPKGITRRFSR